MTLTNFLLARIAEDEDEPCHRWDCDKFNVYDYGLRQGGCDCGYPARVQTQCEAMRRIVEDSGSATPQYDARNRRVLAHLAAIYADHPDYQDEWRCGTAGD